MEEMLKKIEPLILNYNFTEKTEISEYISKNFYLTQSEVREIFQIFEDICSAKNEKIMELIKTFPLDFNLNKKKEQLVLENYFKNNKHSDLKKLNYFKTIYSNLCYLWFKKLNKK